MVHCPQLVGVITAMDVGLQQLRRAIQVDRSQHGTGPGGQLRLDKLAQAEDGAQFVPVQGTHHRAAARTQDDQALRRELPQRLTHWYVAHPELGTHSATEKVRPGPRSPLSTARRISAVTRSTAESLAATARSRPPLTGLSSTLTISNLSC